MSTSRFETLTGEVDRAFPEYDEPPGEPMCLVRRWLADAARQGVREPRAMALATADRRGRPSSRIVAVLDVTPSGAVFTTHRSSQKGRELAANRWASGLLYWRETGQQLILSGPVERLSEAACDDMWYARPTPLHSMSTASRQSDQLVDADSLRAEAARLAALDRPLPRPARFVGYRLAPTVVEFWCASADRLHRRLRFDRSGSGWRASRLQP
ncbi:MAG TPA: phenazine biosynthesis FMN-dependent oxidase PhzG [Rugosimonospora sp.]|nr:phenazine biosynthesis FMN-dependent oxidase PhzG [Rugosimonospora sp.]